jgi:hypothetical protein
MRGDNARTPHVDVLFQMHLMEQGIGSRSPLAALLSAIRTLHDKEHLRCEGQELARVREDVGSDIIFLAEVLWVAVPCSFVAVRGPAISVSTLQGYID